MVNSIILYVKMGVTTVCALITTRFALQALGVVDFGLYSVLGGIITLIGIFNVIMSSTSNRFLAVSIGMGDIEKTNSIFNVNLTIFIILALFMLAVCYPIGDWYIHRHINYDGDINNAMKVYLISICGSILSTLGVPYNGLLLAKEKFIVSSITDVVSHVIRLGVAALLVSHFRHKLLIYTITLALMSGMPTLIYILYCHRYYPDIVRRKAIIDKSLYKEVLSFSSWIGVGAVAMIGKNQGAALLVNAFFSTIMNTALGIANSVNSYIQMFANNVAAPMLPQITKSFVSGNIERVNQLLVMSTKMSFFLFLLMSAPFLVAPEWLLWLWLGEVPPYAALFLTLLIIDNLIQSFNSGISNVIFASGKVSGFQICVSTMNLLSIVLGYIALKSGAAAHSLFIIYIMVSTIKVFAIQLILHKTLHFNNIMLMKKSYLPSIIVLALFLPLLFFRINIHPLLHIFIAIAYLIFLILLLGIKKEERIYIFTKLKIQCTGTNKTCNQ